MNYVTPSGFRDVLSDEARRRERILCDVQRLFDGCGYAPIETPTLEVMDVMRAGGRLPGSPFRFFDLRGDLLAMRPDVTLQVARMCATRLTGQPGPFRFRYAQRVFRETETEAQAAARELMQVGIECIGECGSKADAEVIGLFARALETVGVRDFALSLATVSVLRALLARSGGSAAWQESVLEAFHASNFVELDRLTDVLDEEVSCLAAGAAPMYASAMRQLARIRGGREAIARVRELVEPLGCTQGLSDFEDTFDLLVEAGLESRLLVDFSVVSSFDYYTGVVFEAYSPKLGTPIGSGGRYDNMLGAYGTPRPAAGFSFFLEQAISAAEAAGQPAGQAADRAGDPLLSSDGLNGACEKPLRIAVPKGSLAPGTMAALNAAGLDTTGLDNPGRQLTISNPGVTYIIVRPTDAPVFVALGAADCGICGKDSLVEADPDVVELADLKFGACRFVVAEPAGAAGATQEHYRALGSIRVATKYPNITQAHYAKQGVQVEIVKLHGNIELAPLTGMAERIVDITATGTTLRENNLVIVDEVMESTARFFANTCSFRTNPRILELARVLKEQAEAQAYDPIAGKSQ